MKILVVGGGIYGVTAAVKLAQRGHEVELYEKNDDILKAASNINQFRVHRGYHYPRSNETIQSCLDSVEPFLEEYGDAVNDSYNHYYCVAKDDSLTSREDFISICKKYSLPYEEVDFDLVNKDEVQLVARVDEGTLDPKKLREICWKKLKDHGVKVLLNTEATHEDFDAYDQIVLCTYAIANHLIKDPSKISREYQYEICEKVAIKLPEEYNNISIVVVDGPFMCIDPYSTEGFFLMGNVQHAVHHSSIGTNPEIPKKFKPLLNNGIIKNPPVTHFPEFIETTKKFLPSIVDAEYLGSMFTIRTILPRHINKTDNRPVSVERVDDKTISVFSGKLSNCVRVADKVADLVEEAS